MALDRHAPPVVPGGRLSARALNEQREALRALTDSVVPASMVGTHGIAQRRPPRVILPSFRIVSAADTGVNDAQGNPVQWTYQVVEVFKQQTGYTTTGTAKWITLPNGFSGTAYNYAEDGNDGTGRQMNGVDHDGTLYSTTTFKMQALQVDSVWPGVLQYVIGPAGAITLEPWLLGYSLEDGECG